MKVTKKDSPALRESLPKALKAYDNQEFIHSSDGRIIRILSEYLYPEQYFRKYGIRNTIVVYGSARSFSEEDYQTELQFLEKKWNNATVEEKELLKKEMALLKNKHIITQSYTDCVDMSEMLAKWSMKLPKDKRFYICSGGGPGMMEAANRGAQRAKSPTIGLNISLPFEQAPNSYITPDLNFEFHYFFMRKFWFVYLCKAIVAMPGGFGTLDEIMELLTLIQTQKITRPIPIILYNSQFWKKLINFEFLVDMGMIAKADLDLFVFADTPEEAYEYLKKKLTRLHKLPDVEIGN
ncbi:MAG: LOG family protein [Candidatus Kapaibacterium sp.]